MARRNGTYARQGGRTSTGTVKRARREKSMQARKKSPSETHSPGERRRCTNRGGSSAGVWTGFGNADRRRRVQIGARRLGAFVCKHVVRRGSGENASTSNPLSTTGARRKHQRIATAVYVFGRRGLYVDRLVDTPRSTRGPSQKEQSLSTVLTARQQGESYKKEHFSKRT